VATFQLKNFASITASMVNLMQSTQNKVTDFNIGAIVRTMLEACAAELDELYQQMFNGLTQAIPVSVYNSFSFPALTKQPASGLMTVTISTQLAPTPISAGTVFTSSTTANTYTTSSDVIMPAGQTSASIPVVATTPGAASNIGATTQFSMSPQPSGFISAVNPNAFINGTDDETTADQLIRFNGFISTLQRGTNAAIEFGAKTTTLTDANGNVIERVASAVVVEPFLTNPSLPVSRFFCYIFNGVGNTSASLVSQAQNVVNGFTDINGNRVPGYKAAGTTCTVAAATQQPLNITAAVTAKAGFVQSTLAAQAVSILTAYLLALPVGAPAIFAIIESLVMAIPGVANFVILSPIADTAAAANNNKIMPGSISIIHLGGAAITETDDTVAAV
jgi:hypothetical protein